MELSLTEINWCLDDPGYRRTKVVQDESTMMKADTIALNARCPENIAMMLLAGADKEVLQLAIKDWKQTESDAEIDTVRMNLIGGLRSYGYIVEGGRSGRGVPYRVAGWAPVRDKKDVSIWGGETYSWVKSLERVVATDDYKVRNIMASPLSCDARPIHERSWQYLWCYELARDTGFWYTDEEKRGIAIIIQKHERYPRYRIFNLTLQREAVIELAKRLAPISMAPVKCLCVSPGDAIELKREDPQGFINKRLEAVYRTDRVAQAYDNGILNKRAREMFRANERKILWGPAVELHYQMKTVIDYWRELNEKKHRQLAITRDYQALDYSWDEETKHWKDQDVLRFIGIREGSPCCIHILDPITRSHGVGQIVEKSLNYSAMPGGKPGTADFNLIRTCQWLTSHGIEFINAGGYDGGGYGLPAHKAVFAKPEDDICSISFDFSYKHVEKQEIEI